MFESLVRVGEDGAGGVPRGHAAQKTARAPFKQYKEAQISRTLLSPNEHFFGLLRPEL